MKKKKNTKDEETPLSELICFLKDNMTDEIVDVHVHINSAVISEPCTHSTIINQNIANSIVLFSIHRDATDNPQIQHACDIFKLDKKEFLHNVGELAYMYAHFGLIETKVKLN